MLRNEVDRSLARMGRQIRHLRESSGMTQAEMARKLRVSLEVVGRIEEGRDKLLLDTLLKIARLFGRHIRLRVVKMR